MNKKLISILSIILILISTITYSSLATNLALTSEANIRAVSDIRVTDIEYDSTQSSGGTLSYEPTYTKNTITSGFTLSSTTSQMSYTVTITNNGEIDEAIYNLTSTNNGTVTLYAQWEVNNEPTAYISSNKFITNIYKNVFGIIFNSIITSIIN